MNAKLSLSYARALLADKAPNIVLRKIDGEYRVTFSLAAIARAFPAMTRPELATKAESLAAYESDIESAYETGLAMARVGLVPVAPETDSVAIKEVRTVDVTPTWAAILPLLRAGIENGTAEGRRIAWAELETMAGLADERNRMASTDLRPAIYRPGMYAGPQGDRKMHEWQADAASVYLLDGESV